MKRVTWLSLGMGSACAALLSGCLSDRPGLDPADPARGPGQLVGNGDPMDSDWRGGNDPEPEARDAVPPAPGEPLDCDVGCRSHCDSLDLENPVNEGICSSMWGLGFEHRPVDRAEACRRLYADMLGRFPTPSEVNDTCDQDSWGDVVKTLIDSDEFVLVNQRQWADKLLYNNRAVNFERAFDMDELVGKAYRGKVSWDQFAAVTSAHPIFIRRHDNASDRATALYALFLGRPPYEDERADMARMYTLWNNGYWDHPHLGILPDAFIEFRCVDDNGNPDPDTIGECTSAKWGLHELTLKPDSKRQVKKGDQAGMMWSGFLLPDEWETLQEPGRIISTDEAFWEWAADEALEQYLGYDLANSAPEVRQELVKYMIENDGDIRALHYAIATSFVYLQSSIGGEDTERRWTTGPLKQVTAEGWLDSIKNTTGYDLAECDHRLPHPEDFMDEESVLTPDWGRAVVRNTRWSISEDDDMEVEGDYRGVARTLGGCPSNEIGGRFTTVSVLNTSVQESMIADVCGLTGDNDAISLAPLLPEGVSGSAALDEDLAIEIIERQTRLFLGREPTEEERELARANANECTPAPCDAEGFARPVCFALLSGAEMLFY